MAAALVIAIASGCASNVDSGAPPATAPDAASSMASSGPPSAPMSFASNCGEPHHDLPPFRGDAPVDQEAMRVQGVAPNYPDAARQARISGVVVMWALVCPHGRVLEVRFEDSIPALDAAAATSLSQWTFEPAMRDGKAVASWVRTPMRFTLH